MNQEQQDIASAVFPEVRENIESAEWKRKVLRENMRRTLLHKKPLSYWHWVAAQKTAGTWDIEGTLKVFELDMEAVELEAPQLERAHNESYIPQKKWGASKCGKCDNGWTINHKNDTARPCGCNEHVNEAHRVAVEKMGYGIR